MSKASSLRESFFLLPRHELLLRLLPLEPAARRHPYLYRGTLPGSNRGLERQLLFDFANACLEGMGQIVFARKSLS